MKNIIIVDVDTDRDEVVSLGKGQETPEPTTLEEARDMVFLDIRTLTEALIPLVAGCHLNKFADKDALIERITEHLVDGATQSIEANEVSEDTPTEEE